MARCMYIETLFDIEEVGVNCFFICGQVHQQSCASPSLPENKHAAQRHMQTQKAIQTAITDLTFVFYIHHLWSNINLQ